MRAILATSLSRALFHSVIHLSYRATFLPDCYQCVHACRVGTTFQGKYSDSIKQAYVYPSSNFLDDLTWGACWLYRKTGEKQYLQVCL